MKNRHPKALLKHYWGYDDFRGSQETVIDALLAKQDVLALLPTGGGKSLCFQVPALAQEGICIVISPLVALIQNQVDRLKQVGIKAIALTGGIPYEEVIQLLDNCRFGNYKFLYLSPERLKQDMVQERMQRMNVNLIAIDEAHCISQWGHDFRPAYLECSKLRELLPDTPIVALTATATELVTTDILDNLQMNKALLIKDSFARDNIAFSVVWAEDKPHRLKQLCAAVKNSVIIYVRTRRSAQSLAAYLSASGHSATYFHGGIEKLEKQKRLQRWLTDQVTIMVATNAFGMGIDKPDVSLVVHYQIPDCLENYFQEAGRAGRDGAPAKAVLLTNQTDAQQVKDQFLSVLPDTAFLKKLYNKLNNYFQIAYGEGVATTYPLNFNEFCDTYGLNTLLAYNGLRILDQHSVVALSEAFSQKTTVRMVIGKEELFRYLEGHKSTVPIVQTLLRTYGGVFDYDTKINPHLIAKKSGKSESEVLRVLKKLQENQIIEYQAKESDLLITFLVPREDDRTIHQFAKEVKKRHQLKIENVHHMLDYVNNKTRCRKKQLLAYFGEQANADCGRCDVCLLRKKRAPDSFETIKAQILNLLAQKSYGSRMLNTFLDYEENQVLEALQKLLEDRRITVNTKNEYEIL